ncbi:MAG: lipid A export permease/ATP-binding protein MsbA [Nitrospira sp.]|nr:lipid A export permease/ATP-binding protein MsbA [Nitrospira sp.]
MSGIDRFTRLIRYVGPYRTRFIGGVACAGLVALLTGVYAWLMKPVLDGIFISKNETLLFLLPLAVLAVAVLRSGFSYCQKYLIISVGNRVVTDVRQELLFQLIRLPVGYHDTNTTGRSVSRVTSDVTVMASTVSGVIRDVVQHGLTFVVMIGVIFYQNWKMAGLSLIVMPISGLIMAWAGRRLRKLASTAQERIGDMGSALQETLAGIRIIKAFGREDAQAEYLKKINRAHFQSMQKTNQVHSLGSSYMEVIGVLGVAIIIWYGGSLVIHGEMTPGEFASFLAAMFLAYDPIRRLSGTNNQLQQALAAAERVFDVLDLETEKDKDGGRINLEGVSRSIEFQRVTFVYAGHSVPAVREIDLSVKVGEVVAFVGSSGSGKTTLLSLLPRFYKPTDGRILIDGTDIQDLVLGSLRHHLGIVSQDVVLFDDTVSNNLAFGRVGVEQADIEQAAELAYAHDFILRLPQGYETVIGERGVKLSGGERQRLAIARAILRDPPVLILDEATSALDTESERIVQLALANLMKNRTTLVIAHRLSTIQHADRIVVLDRGAIVETGSHEELLRRGGVYHRLHALQFQDVTRV